MKLLIQPEDGISPLLAAIKKAKTNIDIVIFRFDCAEIEAALKRAVARGVAVNALIAYANRGGEKSLRKLEMRLLGAGVTVSRTADDLVRYHDKFMVIDRKELYVLSFNFTHMDIDHSRGFGVFTRKRKVVAEVLRLFECDVLRKPYEAGLDTLIVSPVNARKKLAALILEAKKELLIYDPKIADREMLRALADRVKKGVVVRILGVVSRQHHNLIQVRAPKFRLHTRTIIRDRQNAFIGSQSLRAAELDARREVGIVVRDAEVVGGLIRSFEADWDMKEPPTRMQLPLKELKRRTKEAATKLSPLTSVAKEAVKEVVAKTGTDSIKPEDMKETMENAVKEAVRERVQEILLEVEDQ